MNFLKGSRVQGLIALCGVHERVGVPQSRVCLQRKQLIEQKGRETGSRGIAVKKKKLQLLFYSLNYQLLHIFRANFVYMPLENRTFSYY